MTPGLDCSAGRSARPPAARALATKPARVRKLRESASRSTRAKVGLTVTSPHALFDVGEQPVLVEEVWVGRADRAVALLGDDDLGDVLQVRVVLLVDAGPENHHDDVGVLLEGARLAQVGELRPPIRSRFGGA